MTAAEKLRVILTTYPKGIYTIDTIEITHSLFTERFLFTREPSGITATLETAEVVTFEGVNFEAELNQKRADLDANFAFTLADPENLLDDQLDLIPFDNTEPIVIVYRAFNSDDLSEPSTVYNLQALNVSQKNGLFTIECGAQQLNWSATGKIYDYDTFPMLRAL